MDISRRPQKKMVREVSRFEDPDDPQRPPALPRPRAGLWAPPGPVAVEPPEMLIVGLGRRLRTSESSGPRARLGAGAVEALQTRYGTRTFFDAGLRSYVATCKASLDKSGQAGVQTINFVQPLVDQDSDAAAAIYSTMQQPGMDRAMVLFAFSDQRLPFGQLRLRTSFDGDNVLVRSAYAALGPENRVTCLHIGCGQAPSAQPLLAAEVGALPRVLGNAATAIELWLSEADLGLVMRFVNRPEVYEMPPGWPYRDALPAADAAAAPAVSAEDAPAGELPAEGASVSSGIERSEDARVNGEPAVLESYNLGSLVGPSEGDEFALFDLNRNYPTALPESMALAPMSPQRAFAALQERPPDCEALRVAGRRFQSLAKLQDDIVGVMLEHEPGTHIRFEDDEQAVKTLISFHPDSDRLLDDLVEVKVDCSPIDDNTRCLWVVKFDGYEEDVSLRECLEGLRRWLEVQPERSVAGYLSTGQRLGLGRWTRGLRETTFERASASERASREANE